MGKFINKLNNIQKFILLILILTISFTLIYAFPIDFFWVIWYPVKQYAVDDTGSLIGTYYTSLTFVKLKLIPVSITLIIETCIMSFFLFKSKK